MLRIAILNQKPRLSPILRLEASKNRNESELWYIHYSDPRIGIHRRQNSCVTEKQTPPIKSLNRTTKGLGLEKVQVVGRLRQNIAR